MYDKAISISPKAASRLAVTKQHLSGKLPKKATDETILSLVRDLCYVQWDPINVIAPSHVIALWSRIGNFSSSSVENLLWNEKKMFYHWTPVASLVLTEDYPLYYSLMKDYPDSLTKSWGNHAARAKEFLAEHRDLRRSILKELKNGPLTLTQFSDYVKTKRSPDGWSSGSDVSNMLSHLHMSGEVMVVGHEGMQNIWGLSEDFLPGWVEKKVLPREEVERQAAERTIGALGTASPSEIYRYFIRGRFENLKGAIQSLEEESRIRRVAIDGQRSRDGIFILERDVHLLDEIETDSWEPRMSLLAHFDNMICVRDWTKRVFGFDYIHEQFLPRNKRKYGTFVLPIIWGDSIIGRIDPRMDYEKKEFHVNSVHAEPGAASNRDAAPKIAETIGLFAKFLGARKVVYSARVPSAWKHALR